MRSVYDAIKAVFSLRPTSVSTDTNGSSVDTQGYNSAAFVLEVGAVTGTTPTLDVKIQESDDASTWSDVSGATFTQVTATGNSQIIRVEDLNNTRSRYLRAVLTLGGTSPVFVCGVEALLGRAYQEPVN